MQFRVPGANPPVKDRVNCLNARLCNYAGDRRVLIAPKCKELAKDLERVGWKTDANLAHRWPSWVFLAPAPGR